MISRDILSKIIENNLELRMNQNLQMKGYNAENARKLFRFISNVYAQIPPELITWCFRVVSPIFQYDSKDKDVLHLGCLKDVFCDECTIIMLSENTFVLERFESSFVQLAHISYVYDSPLNERIYIDDELIPLTEYYDSTTSSVFAYPAYKELEEAMQMYDKACARNSSCGILKLAWKDISRKELCEKPEHIMRDSLYQYLDVVLRNHSVKREQYVDDTHPVDIKVIWPIISNVALIEVKWLGDSGQTKHRDSRANAGAKQLIEYLEWSYAEEPDKNFVGYLAVFDARRDSKNVDHYQNIEIQYRDEYLSHGKMKFYRFYMLERR